MENHQEKLTIILQGDEVTISVTSTSETSVKEVLNQISTIIKHEVIR